MSLPFIAQASDHQELEWMEDSRMSILFDGSVTDRQVTVVRSRLGAGSSSPLHLHHQEDEMFIVLRGEGIFWVGDERHEVGDGGSVFLPRNLPHAYKFVSDEVDLLTICTPSGMEDFFRGAGRDVRDPRPEGWSITMPALAQAAASCGLEILGPPPE